MGAASGTHLQEEQPQHWRGHDAPFLTPLGRWRTAERLEDSPERRPHEGLPLTRRRCVRTYLVLAAGLISRVCFCCRPLLPYPLLRDDRGCDFAPTPSETRLQEGRVCPFQGKGLSSMASRSATCSLGGERVPSWLFEHLPFVSVWGRTERSLCPVLAEGWAVCSCRWGGVAGLVHLPSSSRAAFGPVSPSLFPF